MNHSLNKPNSTISENQENDSDGFYKLSELLFLNKLNMNSTRCLYLKKSNIKNIPDDFFIMLPNLKWLDLRKNLISEIPKSIKNHKALETLLLSNNQIKYLPTELCTVDKLKHIQISNNPLVFPKLSIVNSGIETLKQYLRHYHSQINEDNTDNIQEVISNDIFVDIRDDKHLNQTTTDIIEAKCDKETDVNKPNIVISDSQVNEQKKQKPKYLNSNKYPKVPRALSKSELNKKIKEKAREETLLEKKKDNLSKIESVLQGRKSQEELKNWRDKYKREKNMNPRLDFTTDLSKFPYGTDRNFVKIITRDQLLAIQDSLNKRKQVRQIKYGDNNKPDKNLNARIMEVEKYLHEGDAEQDECTPRKNQNKLSKEILKLLDIQKQIARMKMENMPQ